MKKIFLILMIIVPFTIVAQTNNLSKSQQKKQKKAALINERMKKEEEGLLFFNTQNLFGFQFNTDGYSLKFEHGKYKTPHSTNLWWIGFGEQFSQKESRITNLNLNGFSIGNSYKYGKTNNFFYFKLGIGQQKLIGGKGNKNGVAVSAVYGAGVSLALLKPYYLQVVDSTGENKPTYISYQDNPSMFLNQQKIIGSGGITRGFGQIKIVPGVQAKAALRFDYGRFNQTISAIETGVSAEYYFQKIEQMALIAPKSFFFKAYVGIYIGKRK